MWLTAQLLLGISQETTATMKTLLIGSSFCSIMYTLHSTGKSTANWGFLYQVIVLAGVCQAAYGLGVLLNGTNKVLWLEKTTYIDKATGSFINPNHFCAYLVLCLSLIIGNTLAKQRNLKLKTHWFIEHLNNIYSFKAFSVALILMAIIGSQSLGGILSLVVMIFGTTIIILTKRTIKKSHFILPTTILIGLFIIILSLDYQIINTELLDIKRALGRRVDIWYASSNVLQENWVTGIGAGAFYASFPEYRNLTIGNSFYYYAHNDYIQFWSEYGLIGLCLFTLYIISALYKNIIVLRYSGNVYEQSFAYSSLLATLALGVHSSVDFPLQIHSYALLYLVIISVNINTRH